MHEYQRPSLTGFGFRNTEGYKSRGGYGQSGYNRNSYSYDEEGGAIIGSGRSKRTVPDSRVSASLSERFKEESKKTSGLFSKIHTDFVPERPEGVATDFAIGDRVSHKKWGEGTIVSVKNSPDGQEVKVAFAGAGIRSLLTKYAMLKKL